MKGRQPDSTNIHYQISNTMLDHRLRYAISLFNRFKESKVTSYFLAALTDMKETIKIATDIVNKQSSLESRYDLAYLSRRYATMLIYCQDENITPENDSDSDTTINNYESFSLAKSLLSNALFIHQREDSKTGILLTEHIRVLHQLRKIAYMDRDGHLLAEVGEELGLLLNPDEASKFLVDCHEALFHVAFAKNTLVDLDQAEKHADNCIRIGNEIGFDCSNHQSHKIKIAISRLNKMEITADRLDYFKKHIETPFWEVYDNQKKELRNNTANRNAAKYRLVKILALLYIVRCQMMLIDPNPTTLSAPKDYVLKEANKNFRHDRAYYDKLLSILDIRENELRETHSVKLDYPYFPTLETPALKIPDNKLNLVLPTTMYSPTLHAPTSSSTTTNTTDSQPIKKETPSSSSK